MSCECHCSAYFVKRWCQPAVQAVGRCISAEAFRAAALSGCQFVSVMAEAHPVHGCSVPPETPSLDDIFVTGFIELGTMLQSCGPEW
jgi:hypothetical protein